VLALICAPPPQFTGSKKKTNCDSAKAHNWIGSVFSGNRYVKGLLFCSVVDGGCFLGG